MTQLLEVRDLAYCYDRDQVIFEHVSFAVNPGEVLTLLGPNGAGKSTLLNCLDALIEPTCGDVLIDGEPIGQMSPRALASKVAYVPQTISVTYGYSVREYLVMGAAPRLGMFSAPSKEDYEKVDAVIDQLDLERLSDRAVNRLSGGERQRVAIARAIVQSPKIILFDEPTSALDYGNQIRVMPTIKSLAAQNYAVVMTTHNPDQPILLGGKVGMLDRDGSMVVGEAETALTSDKLSNLYQTDLHLVYVDKADRIACVSSRL